MSEKAKKYLAKNKSIKNAILKKIRHCLEDHLFDTLGECDKHELKGDLKGIWRLKVPYRRVVIYEPVGVRPNRQQKYILSKLRKNTTNG